MDKRLPLFLVLSFLVLVMWPRRGPPESPGADGGVDGLPPPETLVSGGAPWSAGNDPLPPATATAPGPAPDPGIAEPEPWRATLELGRPGEPGHYMVTVDNDGAKLVELALDGYYHERGLDPLVTDNWVRLLTGVENRRGNLGSLTLEASASSAELVRAPLDQVRWEREVLEEGGVVERVVVGVRFTHDPGTGLVFTKTIRAVPGTYQLAVELGFENVGAPELAGRRVPFTFTPAMGVPPSGTDRFTQEPKASVCWTHKGELRIERQTPKYDKHAVDGFPPQAGINWAGVDSKYFAVLLRPEGPTAQALVGAGWENFYDEAWARDHPSEAAKGYRHLATEVELSVLLPEPGESTLLKFLVYAGPKDPRVMREHDEAMLRLIRKDLGYFAGIAGALLAILGFFHGLLGNWGWSIVLLTLFVRLALFPFNRRSQTTMARHATKMKRVQPKLNEVKERYADNPQKMRQEQARIMQEEGAFPPLGGCLPVFAQIPIFFGLFSALRASFDLRQAPFMLWIEDLSRPDQLLRIDFHVPILGTVEYLNVLPPLMVVMWIAQQKFMPKPTDPQALRMQKMMMWMPIMFGFFLYNYPAGLSLYMITTSTFSILEQTVIKKIWPLDDTERPKKKSGFMARLGELQKDAQKLKEMQRREREQRQKGKGKGKGKGRGKGQGQGQGRGKGKGKGGR